MSGIVIASFLLALFALAPARIAANLIDRLTDGRLVLLQNTGSLWQGEGTLYVRTHEGKLFTLGRFDWEISRSSLLIARLQIKVHQKLNERNGQLLLKLTPNSLKISDATFHLPGEQLANLSPVLSTLTPSGVLQLTSDGFEVQNAGTIRRYLGQINLDWQPAIFLDNVHAGAYRITLHGNGQAGLLGNLQTLDGKLNLQGNILLNEKHELRLDGLVRLIPGAESARLLPIFRALCGDGKEQCQISTAH